MHLQSSRGFRLLNLSFYVLIVHSASTSQSSVSDLFRGFIFAFQDLASMNSQLFSVRLAIDMSKFF